jgi:hypothetical protein
MAVPHFEAAAAESPPLEALDLRRRAAEQLLRTGHFDRGLEVSRSVLAAIGMRLPRTRLGTLLSLLFFQLLVTLRGFDFRERAREQIPPEQLVRIDICSSVGLALSYVDAAVGHLFAVRALLLALAAGDLERITRGVGMQVGVSAVLGAKAWRRTERLIQTTNDLAKRCASTQARWFAIGPAATAYYLSARFRESVEQHYRALEMTQDASAGLSWEQVATRSLLISALARVGGFRELRRLQQEGLRDAQARGDLYASVSLRTGEAGLAWLMEDRPDLAESHARAALSEWSTSGFHTEHFTGLLGLTNVKLYVGDATEAYRLATELFERTQRSLLWRVLTARATAQYLRAGAALAMVEAGLGDRAELLRQAARAAHGIERLGMPGLEPYAAVLRGGIALRGGDRASALVHLDAAHRGFESGGMSAYAAATRVRAARLRGDDAASIAEAHAFFEREDVAVPERMIALHVPGLDLTS